MASPAVVEAAHTCVVPPHPHDVAAQRRYIVQSYHAQLRAIRHEHAAAMERLRHAQRHAVHLPEPQRGCQLDRIKRQRRVAIEVYKQRLLDARHGYQQSLAELRRQRHAVSYPVSYPVSQREDPWLGLPTFGW